MEWSPRNCGQCVCDNCSPHRDILPHLNVWHPTRVCSACHTLLHDAAAATSASARVPAPPQQQPQHGSSAAAVSSSSRPRISPASPQIYHTPTAAATSTPTRARAQSGVAAAATAAESASAVSRAWAALATPAAVSDEDLPSLVDVNLYPSCATDEEEEEEEHRDGNPGGQSGRRRRHYPGAAGTGHDSHSSGPGRGVRVTEAGIPAWVFALQPWAGVAARTFGCGDVWVRVHAIDGLPLLDHFPAAAGTHRGGGNVQCGWEMGVWMCQWESVDRIGFFFYHSVAC